MRVFPLIPALLAWLVVGCSTLAGRVMHDSRERFNEVAQRTNAEQLLRNLVRLRFAESPYFLEISNVTTSATMSGSVALAGNTVGAIPGLDPNLVVSPSVAFSQTPSFIFQPLTGEKLGRQLLRPVELRTLALLRTAGWDLRDILLMMVDTINGIPNAPGATQLSPEHVPDNAEFRRVIDLIERLEEGGLIELGLEPTPAAPDPRGDIALSLRIERSAAGRDDVQELIRRLALDPQDLTYRFAAAATGGGGKHIVVKPRSVLAAMRYLSKGIEVPDTLASEFDGAKSAAASADWQAMLDGRFAVRSSPTLPLDAYISVEHDGRWYSIARDDLVSKHAFALLETVFALQGSDVPPMTTVLTLPVGR
jgi:hypothetical protein